jgi:hypothetical protein
VEKSIPALNKSSYLWAIINLLITLSGIFFLHWSLQPIIYLFWLEIIFNVVSALIRAMGAMDGKPFLETLKQKVFLLIAGTVMGIAMIMLTVTFTIGVFENFDFESFIGIQEAILVLAGNYVLALLLNFFFNGYFRNANPLTELVSTLIYLVILLLIIMVITQHLIPSLNLKNNAMWIGVAVVGIKFLVDFLASYFRAPLLSIEEAK